MRILDFPTVVCATDPGDVILFDVHIWHASSWGSQGRRMCSSISYGIPRNAEEAEATKLAEVGKRVRTQLKWKEHQHHPQWVVNPHAHLRRQRWNDWMTRWDFLDTAAQNPRIPTQSQLDDIAHGNGKRR